MTKPAPAPDLTDHHHRPAGIVTRAAALGVDLAMGVVIGSILYLTVAGARFIWSPTSFSWPDMPFFLTLTVQFCIAVVYLTFCWATTGRTYGDSLLGLRVLSMFGRVPGWTLSFVRAVFCVFVPVGLFWVILSPERRSIQDVVLRTVVVYDWRGAE